MEDRDPLERSGVVFGVSNDPAAGFDVTVIRSKAIFVDDIEQRADVEVARAGDRHLHTEPRAHSEPFDPYFGRHRADRLALRRAGHAGLAIDLDHRGDLPTRAGLKVTADRDIILKGRIRAGGR